MLRPDNTLACLIEYDPEADVDTYLVSFEEMLDGGSQKAAFSSLEEALQYARDTFPTVIDKWKMSKAAR